MNPPPICDNCRRIVFETKRVGIMVEGSTGAARELCSACRVHVLDCFEQSAPWIGAPAKVRA